MRKGNGQNKGDMLNTGKYKFKSPRAKARKMKKTPSRARRFTGHRG